MIKKQQFVYKIRVTDPKKVLLAIDWCTNNLKDNEWELTPIHLFKGDYWFKFNCPQNHLLAILGCV